MKFTTIRAMGVAAFILSVFASVQAHAYEPWKTTDFKVVLAVPYAENPHEMSEDAALEEATFQADEDIQKAIGFIEVSLREVAIWFRDLGFPPPDLIPMIQTENGWAYKVYLCDRNLLQRLFGSAGYNSCGRIGEYVLAGCHPKGWRNRYMYINHEFSLDEKGQLTELGYFTVAHELFHAISGSTKFVLSDPGCEMGDWIAEGLADAVSIDFAESTWKGYYKTDPTQINKRWGYRPYSLTLPQRSKNQGGGVIIPGYEDIGKQDLSYTTSSFWRYLGDSNPQGWRFLVTSKENGRPGILDAPLENTYKGVNWKNEVAWLDKGLKKHFGRGLRSMYSLFVNRVPFHIPEYQKFKGNSMQENFEAWVKLLFGQCTDVDLASSTSQAVPLQLEPITSRCIWIKPFGQPGLAPVTFTAVSNDLSLLQDMTIGRSGTTLESRPGPLGSSSVNMGTHYATWRDFPQDGSQKNLYIVSNIASKPAETRPRELTLVVSRGGHTASSWESTPMAAKMAPPPIKPSHKKHVPTLAKQLAATGKMVQQQAELDKQSVNPNVSSGNTMHRKPDRRECKESFKYQPCGPTTNVELGLRPGTYGSIAQTTGQGGIASQTFSGLQAMAGAAAGGQASQVPEFMLAKNAIDGSDISIEFPMVDYGFTGTVERAAISVTMKDEKILQAIGPPDNEGRQLLMGKVTIDEYSPHILRGSYSAPLGEIVEETDGSARFESRETVTGTFTIVAPWQSDERIAIVHDDQEQMVEDLTSTMGVSSGTSYEIIQVGDRQKVVTKQGNAASSGGGSTSGECTCECEMIGKVDELCEMFCEEEFAACQPP